MKLLKTLLVCAGALSLFACNMGDNVGTDVQTITASNNDVSTVVTATGCRTIPSGGSCSLSINYQARQSGIYNNTNLVITTPGNYSAPYTCNPYSSTSQTCNVTVNSIGSTSAAQTISVAPNVQNAPTANIIIGGGLN